MAQLRDAWKAADAMGVDSIWTWDHFYPLYGEPDGGHFEGYTVLAAMAADTAKATIGMLVTCNSYRNPELLADMARTVDHISGGRHILGIGSGWFERDYTEYGYDFGTAPGRLKALGEALPRIKDRLGKLNPGPLGNLPIMIGGGGEKVTLKLVAQYADMHNTFGPPDNYAHKNKVIDEWCEKLGRDPKEIQRTVAIMASKDLDTVDELVEAGAQHVIYGVNAPYELDNVQRLMEMAKG